MESEREIIRHRKTLAILAFVALFFVTAALWVVSSVGTTPSDEAKVSNINDIGFNVGPVVKSAIQKSLRTTIKSAYGIEDGKDPVGVIRAGTVTTETQKDETRKYKFLIDVDNYQVTYAAELWVGEKKNEAEIYFYCVPPDQSKFPDNFCVGYNGHSTIDVTIGKSLPLTARETINGYYYDARMATKPGTLKPYIDIFVSSCGDQKVVKEVRQDFEDWIKEQGYEPELYDTQIPDSCTDRE